MEKRKKCLDTTFAKLSALSFTSNQLHPKVKAQLFKSYIRPVVTFGCENMPLNELDLNIFKRLECNSVKKMLKIPKRCHSSSLLEALHIETTKSYCIRMKIKFVLRLNNNVHTHKMLMFMCNDREQNSFTSEKAKHLNLNQDYDHSALIIACESFLKQSKVEKYQQKKNPIYTNVEEVLKIKQILDITNRHLIPAYLFNIIKFQTMTSKKKVCTQLDNCINSF
jgi:hypothetical protein